MLLGGWGSRTQTPVAAAARELGLELAHDGVLTLAAPAGSMTRGQAGARQAWLIGRLDDDDVPAGLRPAGASQATVAAAALDGLGVSAQAFLHGAYLLVSHDRVGRTALVSHDHLGARTVCFSCRGADVFFAEHLVDLLRLLPATPVPDRLAVVQWIDRETLPGRRSLYSGIERLPAGHALDLRDTGAEVRCFWRPIFREPSGLSASAGAAGVRTAAFSAVRRAAGGLARPAVKLSGGLDSACIAAGLAAIPDAREALAFAGLFPDYPGTDESRLIEQTARMAELELVTVEHADVPIFSPVREYISRWAVPPWSPSIAIWRPLMAAARSREVDGLLDGEGGDELFGLHRYLIADRLCHGRVLSAWRLAAMLPGVGPAPGVGLRLRILRANGVGAALPQRAQQLRRRLVNPREGIGPMVRDADVPGLLGQDERWSWKTGDGPIWWTAAVDRLLNGAHRLDASGELLRGSVDAGIDQRHPFLHDARLVEALLSIAPEHQFDAVRDRPLLRDGLAGLVPEAVRTRFAKSYFNDVVARPLAGPEGSALLRGLAAPEAPIHEYVRAGALDGLATLATARQAARNRLAMRLFRLASVDCWLRRLGQ